MRRRDEAQRDVGIARGRRSVRSACPSAYASSRRRSTTPAHRARTCAPRCSPSRSSFSTLTCFGSKPASATSWRVNQPVGAAWLLLRRRRRAVSTGERAVDLVSPMSSVASDHPHDLARSASCARPSGSCSTPPYFLIAARTSGGHAACASAGRLLQHVVHLRGLIGVEVAVVVVSLVGLVGLVGRLRLGRRRRLGCRRRLGRGRRNGPGCGRRCRRGRCGRARHARAPRPRSRHRRRARARRARATSRGCDFASRRVTWPAVCVGAVGVAACGRCAARCVACPARRRRRGPAAASRGSRRRAAIGAHCSGGKLRRRVLQRHAHRVRRVEPLVRRLRERREDHVLELSGMSGRSARGGGGGASTCLRSRSNSESADERLLQRRALEQDHADRVDDRRAHRPCRPAACSGDM